ncbi:hypothetical protein [Arthrobacter sp. PAMC 25486]|uniref:hypothetical protein n=1 Tax=Arthrobacter sp. PAMC 25486 TaxID=1494608 RepID=UPI0005704129|nr:hypothetical protein [Arthrobacter sp. PAMC 25486]
MFEEDPRLSAHPDWDQLYAAGTPVPVIAEQTGVRVGTVHRHLEVRRAMDPSLAKARAAAPKGPSRIWRSRLQEARTFIATHGRYPQLHGPVPREQKLYAFLCEQRHALVAQTISWEQMRELD